MSSLFFSVPRKTPSSTRTCCKSQTTYTLVFPTHTFKKNNVISIFFYIQKTHPSRSSFFVNLKLFTLNLRYAFYSKNIIKFIFYFPKNHLHVPNSKNFRKGDFLSENGKYTEFCPMWKILTRVFATKSEHIKRFFVALPRKKPDNLFFSLQPSFTIRFTFLSIVPSLTFLCRTPHPWTFWFIIPQAYTACLRSVFIFAAALGKSLVLKKKEVWAQ